MLKASSSTNRTFGVIMIKTSIYVFVFACVLGSSREPSDDLANLQAMATKVANAINFNDYEDLYNLYSAKYKKITKNSMEITNKFISNIKINRGIIISIGAPEFVNNWGKYELVTEKGRCLMEISVDSDGQIESLLIKDAPPILEVPDRNRIALRLPVSGMCYVSTGGPTIGENAHRSSTKDAKFAVDFVILDEERKSCKGDGAKNEDYFIYGKEVLAASDGEVFTVIDGVPDNEPFSLNPHSYSGNTVIIKHSELEFSVYMHLMPYSIKPKTGMKIKSGNFIGKIGNSGTSTGPHLHFQMMNSGSPQKATGFPPFFKKILVSNEAGSTLLEDYCPRQGDYVMSK